MDKGPVKGAADRSRLSATRRIALSSGGISLRNTSTRARHLRACGRRAGLISPQRLVQGEC
jgi:hypothetical protein